MAGSIATTLPARARELAIWFPLNGSRKIKTIERLIDFGL
jgi:hypothetical protein